MKIIIEGVDGVGKTSLALKLAEVLGLEYCHDSNPRTYEEYYKELINDKARIYDRFFFGQFAGYQSNSERLLTYPELIDLLNLCKKRGIIVIVCYDDPKKIKERFKNTGSDQFWMKKLQKDSIEGFIEDIQKGFLEVASLSDNVNLLNMSNVIKNKKE